MSPWQERVISEKAELDARIMTLHLFIASPVFDTIDGRQQDLMHQQRELMARYSEVLAKRLGLIE